MNTRTTEPTRAGALDLAGSWPARLAGAALCLVVAVIHVKDQGGFPGDKTPTYVGVLYYVLEVAAVVAAGMLLTRSFRSGWLLSLGVALGPLVGYVLSRGPGMPLYTGDRGNWTETLSVISLAVEVTLLLLSLAATARRGDDIVDRQPAFDS